MPFNKINIQKRKTALYSGELELLYPNGRKIDQLKYSNFIDLLPYIPSIHHEFYHSLQVNSTTINPFTEVNENIDILELHCVEHNEIRENKEKEEKTDNSAHAKKTRTKEVQSRKSGSKQRKGNTKTERKKQKDQ